MPWECARGRLSWTKHASSNNPSMKLVRMSTGHGDVLLAEGDPEVAEEQERLIEEFRRQLDLGMWAAVPHDGAAGRREATMVREFSEVPDGADRVIFFPPAAGG
jgi:molybdopterin converting factor small subunit